MSSPLSDELRASDDGGDPATLRIAETIDVRPAADVTAPQALGRYAVLGRIARGGMGEVIRAYDPKLRREVALKLVRARDPASSARMLREAQALAQLAHPNVVAIYDVGEHEGAVYIAMEYVEGRTLRAWWKDEAPDWRRTLAVFREAARGLAAAHRAGLVHRDVKPDNILVGAREGPAGHGRVRVLDFGLARADASAEDPHGGSSSQSMSGDSWSLASDPSFAAPLTEAGTVMGTPAYMAPEQHAGLTADARTDQYALCVALFEALYGARPFAGKTARELRAAKQRGEIRVPTDAKVPRFVARAVLRGLSAQPDDRWSSLDELLAALDRDPSRMRNRIVAVGAVLAIAAAGYGLYRLDRQRIAAGCEDDGEAIATVWNDDARAQVRAGLLATEAPFAPATADGVTPWLDRYADQWRSARTETCLAARRDQTWSTVAFEHAQSCLDDRRLELEALVAELSRADLQVVQLAVQAATGLTSIDRCRDPDLMARLPPTPTDRRDEIQHVRAELSRAFAFERAGRYDEALALARTTLEASEALGWTPLVAESRGVLALALMRKGELAEAETAAETAYIEAASSAAWSVAASAADFLLHTVGYQLGRRSEGLRWARMYDVAVANEGGTQPYREAAHLRALGDVHHAAGDYAESQAVQERSLALLESALGPDHPDVATALGRLAISHLAVGHRSEALALHERALAKLEAALGPDHPDVAASLVNLGNVHYELGALAEAKAMHERALAVWEAGLGPNHLDVGAAVMNLGNVHHAMGDFPKAKALFERALAIREAALGPDHPDIAPALGNLGNVAFAMGDSARAKQLLLRANEIMEAAYGPDHPTIGLTFGNLGQLHLAAGELDEAKSYYERSLVILEKIVGSSSEDLVLQLLGLAQIARDRGDTKTAIRHGERALAIRESSGAPARDLAEVRLALARSLWGSPRDRPRARELAEQAAAELRGAAPANPTLLAETETWLADHAL